jgi:hypothetical protein
VKTVTYPNGGVTLKNKYDSMGRLSVVREELFRGGRQPNYIDWANNAVYGPAGELKNLSWVIEQSNDLTTAPDLYGNETRTYNSLTGLTATGSYYQQTMNLTYSYSATANNGQIVSMANNLSGETVTYQYDAGRFCQFQRSGGSDPRWYRVWLPVRGEREDANHCYPGSRGTMGPVKSG